ncbi:hypothetical protein SeMB42_g02589 [Synchytrium endobioticum]|uniref:Uncharacterized protein n=1 Tax=Synchytrium endobioticum TaxID=286115 RepID=A0A507CNW0_9FUNG|nr:hypothetical protein SeLEV6574_g06396 [Synchytrium endobioticum]TPX49490.1 hypothetical protein SeMB42_g02589 [Synchytrium endobioticum]
MPTKHARLKLIASASTQSSCDRSKIRNIACTAVSKHQLECMNNPKSVEQGILDVYMAAFKCYLIGDAEVESKLRLIKQHFVNRDYAAIFNNDAGLLRTYSATYAPCRALLFHDFFVKHERLQHALSNCNVVFSLGSGTGAELVGLTAALLQCRKHEIVVPNASSNTNPIVFHVQDMADYSSCLTDLTASMSIWQLPRAFETRFTIADVASPDTEAYMIANVAEADVITCFFILNELLQADKTGFVRLITSKREYMAYTFLDLLVGWTMLAKEDSCWYRFPPGLSYPTPLQNSRYYYRILQKNAS